MRTSRVLVRGVYLCAAATAWVLCPSCGSSSPNHGFGTDAGASAETGGGDTGTPRPDAHHDTGTIGLKSGDGGLTEAGACSADTYAGQVVLLDIYMLIDATASMTGSNGSPVVWPSLTSALQSIITDASSQGIGMGLTFMPVPPAIGFKVPGTCTTDTDCSGSTGPCAAVIPLQPKVCTNACTVATAAQDCGLYGDCTVMLKDKLCTGALSPKVSCDPADYGTPVVPIATLPGNQSTLLGAINGKSADGDATPTQPALQGALTYAHQWAVSHPTHLVNVLFGTDGLPNDCTGDSTLSAAEATAQQYYQGAPSIPTFVLGMGSLSDLNALAAAGGTTQAYIADASSVAQTMVTMFNQIRANGACQFQIPQPQSGEQVDYGKVNVSYTPPGAKAPVTVDYVGDASQCDATTGGWYYDVAPSKGTPTKILLCAATCKQVQLSTGGVSVLVGCTTVSK